MSTLISPMTISSGLLLFFREKNSLFYFGVYTSIPGSLTKSFNFRLTAVQISRFGETCLDFHYKKTRVSFDLLKDLQHHKKELFCPKTNLQSCTDMDSIVQCNSTQWNFSSFELSWFSFLPASYFILLKMDI